ncbi:MAG: hypothetical protein ACHQK9_05855 [Reyranellales bacterium]
MPAVKLSFGNLLSESFGFFFGHLPLFFHLVTIPWILSLALRIGGAAVGEDSVPAMLAEKALDVVPTVMFTVAWMRAVLLGPRQNDRLPGLGWSARETAFLIHLLKVGGMTYVLIAAFTLIAGMIDPGTIGQAPVDPELARREAMAAPLGLGFIVSALLALRVAFGLAATAVDVPFSPRLAWAYSRGNAWTIIGALFLIFVTGAIATMMALLVPISLVRGMLGADSAAAVIAWTAAILASYAGTGVISTALAITFRELTSWRHGAALQPIDS